MEKVHNFMGNAIYHFNDEFMLNTNEIKTIQKLKVNEAYAFNKEDCKFFISDDKKILNDDNLKRLKEYFHLKINKYINDVLCIKSEVQLTNSWYTINKKGGKHHDHRHRNAFVSLVYYPKISGGGILFSDVDPLITLKMNMDFHVIKENEFNCNSIEFKPTNNDGIIFPGWVTHESLPNDSDEDRIMIGANYWVKGEYGTKNQVNQVKI